MRRFPREYTVTRISRQKALRYLKIRPGQLRAWEQKSLIPHRAEYSLEEIGRLRTLRDLATRFSSASISASLGAMKAVCGIENPLLDARAFAGGSRLHFWHGGCVTDPLARQLVFNFDPPGDHHTGRSAEKPTPFTVSAGERDARVSEMFMEAIQVEDAADFDRAARLYEQILSANPDHAPACINLGTICYNRRQFIRAEELYRRAADADPAYALAFFDLGNVLDELKRLPEAIEAYRTAIRLVPTYADAHYNLALACERRGEHRLALRHWTAYLKLDSNTRWAAHARKQIHKILDRESLTIVHRSSQAALSRFQRPNLHSEKVVSTAS